MCVLSDYAVIELKLEVVLATIIPHLHPYSFEWAE